MGVQYHPEYISRPMRPSAPYLGLLLAATGKLPNYLAKLRSNSASPSSGVMAKDSDFSEEEDKELDEEMERLGYQGQ